MLANTDHQAPATVVFCNGAAIKFRLMEEQACGCSTVRGGQGLKVRARRFCRRHSELRVCLPTPTRHLHWLCSANGAAIKLRLMDKQACGCSTVRGGQGLKVRLLVSAAGTRGGAVLANTDQTPAMCSANGADCWRSKFAAAPRCEADRDSKCVCSSLSPALGWSSACQTPTGTPAMVVL